MYLAINTPVVVLDVGSVLVVVIVVPVEVVVVSGLVVVLVVPVVLVVDAAKSQGPTIKLIIIKSLM